MSGATGCYEHPTPRHHPRCALPGWWQRLSNGVQSGTIWHCSCGIRYTWNGYGWYPTPRSPGRIGIRPRYALHIETPTADGGSVHGPVQPIMKKRQVFPRTPHEQVLDDALADAEIFIESALGELASASQSLNVAAAASRHLRRRIARLQKKAAENG